MKRTQKLKSKLKNKDKSKLKTKVKSKLKTKVKTKVKSKLRYKFNDKTRLNKKKFKKYSKKKKFIGGAIIDDLTNDIDNEWYKKEFSKIESLQEINITEGIDMDTLINQIKEADDVVMPLSDKIYILSFVLHIIKTIRLINDTNITYIDKDEQIKEIIKAIENIESLESVKKYNPGWILYQYINKIKHAIYSELIIIGMIREKIEEIQVLIHKINTNYITKKVVDEEDINILTELIDGIKNIITNTASVGILSTDFITTIETVINHSTDTRNHYKKTLACPEGQSRQEPDWNCEIVHNNNENENNIEEFSDDNFVPYGEEIIFKLGAKNTTKKDEELSIDGLLSVGILLLCELKKNKINKK